MALATPDNNTEDANTSGNFIVFDLSTFIFSTDAKFTRAALEPAFKLQNAAVLATQPRPAVTSLIQGWYGGATLPNATADDTFVPTAWKTQDVDALKPLTSEKLYQNVVRTCRTCHTPLVAQNLAWDTYAKLTARANTFVSEVCGTDLIMPHDAIAYLNFWRFMPPASETYPMGGLKPPLTMKQPFLDMGAFLTAQSKAVGVCKNTKGQPPR